MTPKSYAKHAVKGIKKSFNNAAKAVRKTVARVGKRSR